MELLLLEESEDLWVECVEDLSGVCLRILSAAWDEAWEWDASSCPNFVVRLTILMMGAYLGLGFIFSSTFSSLSFRLSRMEGPGEHVTFLAWVGGSMSCPSMGYGILGCRGSDEYIGQR